MEKTLKERTLHRLSGALTVALAVFVLLVCWVLCTQQKASAADQMTSGTYHVWLDTWGDSSDKDKAFSGTFTYMRQDGSTGSFALPLTCDQSWHTGYHYELDGYPYSIWSTTRGNPFDEGEINVRVYVNSVNNRDTATCLVNHTTVKCSHAGGGTVSATYYIDSNSYDKHSSDGSTEQPGTHYWPGVGISSIEVNSTQKRTYKLDANGNPTNYSSWTGTGFTDNVTLNGETYTQYRIICRALDKFGVRIFGTASVAEMWGVATYDNYTNRSGFEVEMDYTNDWFYFYGTLMPEAHVAGQNRNQQTVHMKVGFEYNSDPKNKEYTLTSYDEQYTTQFYDREGTLRKGNSGNTFTSAALNPTSSGRTSFATATNKDGVQYTYYGDAVYAPFDYTGTDDPSTRFMPMNIAAGESVVTAAGTPKYGNTDELRAKVRQDAATYHFVWKGWTPLVNDNGVNDASVRNINNASRYDGARTGPAARYETAKDNLILQECFTKVKHTPDSSNHLRCPLNTPADCTSDATYFKVCTDATCRYKFTIKGEGALGKGVDYLWTRMGSMKHHKWDMAPNAGPYHAYEIDNDNIVHTSDYSVPADAITAFSETCTDDGSHGYFHCENCGKYFAYNKVDDDTDEYWLVQSDYTTPMDEDEIAEEMKIPAPGHDYQFGGWTWGTNGTGGTDYNTVTGTISCLNTDLHRGLNEHTFTLSTTEAPTTSNNKTRVNKVADIQSESDPKPQINAKIFVNVKDATCTANGSKVYSTPEDLTIRITPPEQGADTIEVSTSKISGTEVLLKLGHDYRGEYVGTGFNRRTGTYTGHQRKCVRCVSVGINLTYDANDNVTSTNPGGTVAHNDTTVTSSPATCQVYAVCADCRLPFGNLASHDFTADPNRISSADDATEMDDALPISSYAGHYYACVYGCGSYGVMRNETAYSNGTETHNFDANGDGVVTSEDGVLLRPTSCTVNGRRVYTCVDCGFKHYTQRGSDLTATGHDYTGQEVTLTPFMNGDEYNATMTASVTCKNPNCNKYDEQGNQITQVRSTITETVDIITTRLEPTCTENGSVTRTATFTDPAFVGTLLNGEPFATTQVNADEVLSATGHNWVNVKVEWSADHSTCTGSAECANNPAHNVTQSAKVTSQVTLEPTCLEGGKASFKANFEDEEGNIVYYDTFSMPKRSFQDIYNQQHMDEIGDIPAAGHVWNDAEYTWYGDADNGYDGVDAYISCSKCDAYHEESVNVTRTTTAATCEADGEILWTAEFENTLFAPQTKSKTLPMLGHEYNFEGATYKWTKASGNWRCTATAVCDHDRKHVITETAQGDAVTIETIPATCDNRGKTVYTATFENENFRTQVHEEEIAALGHRWDEPEIEWEFDDVRNEYVSVTGTIRCLNDPENTHASTEVLQLDDGGIIKRVNKPATCDSAGVWGYRARFSSKFGTQNITQPIPKLNHEFGEIHEGKQNNCATGGFKSYCICNNCGKTFVQDDQGNWVENANPVLYPNSDHSSFERITVPAKAATCTEAGTKAVEYCEGCKLIFAIDGEDVSEQNYRYGTDKTQYELALDPAAHSALVEVPGEPATCEHVGVLHHWYCSACDKYYDNAEGTSQIPITAIELEVTGHVYDFENATYVWSEDHSTCTATAVCVNNAEHKKIEEGTIEKNVVTPVTCEADGECSYTATFESTGFTAQTTEVMTDPMLGHDYDYAGKRYKPTYNWSEDYSACTATFYCKNDNAHTREIVGTVTSNTEINQDCEVDGKIVYTATFDQEGAADATQVKILPKTEHVWNYTNEEGFAEVEYEWSPDGNRCTAIIHCKNNPEHTKQQTVVAELVPIIKSTCTTAGLAMYEANFTNGIAKAESEPFEMPKLGHKLERFDAVAASCIEEGSYVHYHCSQCGKNFSDSTCTREMTDEQIIQQKIEHSKVYHQPIAPSCTENGSLEYWTCSFCGKYFLDEACTVQTNKDAVNLGATGHKLVDVTGKPATCTEAGWEDYQTCVRCKVKVGYVSIPATGHGDYIYDYASSSTSADGSIHWDVYSCGHGCGAFYSKLTITMRDANGKPLPNANVNIVSSKTGATIASGTTDKYGEFAPNAQLTEGNYKITVSYEDSSNAYFATTTMTFYTDGNNEPNVIPGKLGKTDFALDPGATPSQPDSGTAPGVCKWCGEVHTGFFGKITQFFHNLLAIFSRF